MGVKVFAVLLVTFAFYSGGVMGSTDCTLPWLMENNPWVSKIESLTINRCPSLIGDSDKEYCCYNTKGEVECCNFQEFLIFGFILLIPILIILLILSSILSCICCLCCPCCAIYKRRQGGRVLVLSPTINHVIVDVTRVEIPDNQIFASASSGYTPLIPNEYPPQYSSKLKTDRLCALQLSS